MRKISCNCVLSCLQVGFWWLWKVSVYYSDRAVNVLWIFKKLQISDISFSKLVLHIWYLILCLISQLIYELCRLGHREQKDEWAPRRVDLFQNRNVLPADAIISAGSVNSSCTAGMHLIHTFTGPALIKLKSICWYNEPPPWLLSALIVSFLLVHVLCTDNINNMMVFYPSVKPSFWGF